MITKEEVGEKENSWKYYGFSAGRRLRRRPILKYKPITANYTKFCLWINMENLWWNVKKYVKIMNAERFV